jgi:CubicO group peptidase (beta-lactamase class C family)
MSRTMVIAFLSTLMIACGSPSANKPVKDTAVIVNTVVPPVSFKPLTTKEKEYYVNTIEPLYRSLLLRTGFNGSILMAKNGEIVFEDYHGLINFKTGDSITPNSPFHLASISKTFTATVILRLMEQGKLALEDGVEKYLSGFPYSGITIKDLLSHRSGLPKYDHFMTNIRTEPYRVKNRRGRWITRYRSYKIAPQVTGFATNETVLQYMINNRPAVEALPNRRFSYCNTNYAMLALVVEKVTHIPFPQYMKDSVFAPLGMKDSYVFSIRDTASYTPSYNYNRRVFPLEKLDCVYGDKNVYSTVRDLLQWDQSLYKGTLVSLSTLQKAYQPYSNEHRGIKNYGLGWHLLINPPDPTIIYHNGWWHGNNTVFKRLVHDSATVIILGNKFNPAIWRASKMSSVFTGHADTTVLEQ